MGKITEEQFYAVCDKVDVIDQDITEGYFPTVEELISHNVKEKMQTDQQYLKFIAYYASDPLSRFGYEVAETQEYKEAVKYVRKLLNEMPLG